MAHTCPVCGQTCYCNGDIDDIILDTEEAVAKCTHCSEYEDDSSQCDYCDAAVRADKAERERDEAQAGAAQMREALELLAHYPREVCIGTKHYQYLANLMPKHHEQVQSALSTDSGKATLEYIKGLEAENEAMRRLLKQIQKDYELCPGCDPETGVYGCKLHNECGALKRYLAINAYLRGGGQRG